MDSSQATRTNRNLQTSEEPYSVVMALNKLKETEDRIYEAKHKLGWIHTRNSRMQNSQMRRTHVSHFRGEIRSFADNERSLKEEHQRKMQQQKNRYHEMNEERRKSHKQKLSELRETMHSQNKWVHDEIRKQKEMNEKSIEKAKKKELLEKRKNREEKFESEQRRIAYMREYMKNREMKTKLSKAEETNQILSRVAEREKLLEQLERNGSELSCEANPEEENSKNSKVSGKSFRVKEYKSYTSVMIE